MLVEVAITSLEIPRIGNGGVSPFARAGGSAGQIEYADAAFEEALPIVRVPGCARRTQK